jgi:hypothetical protein
MNSDKQSALAKMQDKDPIVQTFPEWAICSRNATQLSGYPRPFNMQRRFVGLRQRRFRCSVPLLLGRIKIPKPSQHLVQLSESIRH